MSVFWKKLKLTRGRYYGEGTTPGTKLCVILETHILKTHKFILEHKACFLA